MEHLLFMLVYCHWFAPKLLALKIIKHSYLINANARQWMSTIVPIVGIVSCYLISLFLEFVLACTVLLLARGYLMPLVLQVVWWIYLVDLLSEAGLNYYVIPSIIYSYCLISTAFSPAITLDVYSISFILFTFNFVLYIYDVILTLGKFRNHEQCFYNIHLPLLSSLYMTIIFYTFSIISR